MFLRETLWEFSRETILTDLVFVCQDQQRVEAHKAILSRFDCCGKLFSSLPAGASSTIILPDWTRSQVQTALQEVYLNKNPLSLEKLLGNSPLESLPSQQTTEIFQEDSYFTGGLEYKTVTETATEEEIVSALLLKTEGSVEERRPPDNCNKIACDVCGLTVSKIREHMLRKHPDTLDRAKVAEYQCPHCEYTTRIKSSLTQHIKNLHTERKLSCEQCGYRAAGAPQLRQHLKKVHSPATINCPVEGCKRKFVQSCDIKDHLKRVHSTGLFNCHLCGKQFVNEEKMKRHIKMHNIDNEGLPCQHCHLKFITKQKLREHTNTHTGDTPYRCPASQCDKAFMSSSSLSHHKRVCSGVISGQHS